MTFNDDLFPDSNIIDFPKQSSVDTKSTDKKSRLTITELNSALKKQIEAAFPEIFFQGELAEVKFQSSGHLYVTLKDENSSIRCAMWKGYHSKLDFKPAVGMQVFCTGKASVYANTASLQIEITRMELSGEGLLKKKFEDLKLKLQTEGLFDPARKRKPPKFPKNIGVVTSATGAVIHDIMVRLKSRMPTVNVYLVNAKVQGDGAVKDIVAGINLLNKFSAEQTKIDVMIVGRGGGSYEDLWSFNEEEVVRAIFSSAIPVISAVGHEVDTTLADFAADVRAPTPTAAAEMVVPDRQQVLAYMQHQLQKLDNAFERALRNRQQNVDEISSRIERVTQRNFNETKSKLMLCKTRLSKYEPTVLISRMKEKISNLKYNLEKSITLGISIKYKNLDRASHTLQALNPLKVLERGYAYVQVTKDGKSISVSDSAVLSKGEEVSVRLGKGKFSANVINSFKS